MNNRGRLPQRIAEMEATLERMKVWRDEAPTDPARVERAEIVRAYAHNLREARERLTYVEKMRDRIARLEEHRTRPDVTWGETFGGDWSSKGA